MRYDNRLGLEAVNHYIGVNLAVALDDEVREILGVGFQVLGRPGNLAGAAVCGTELDAVTADAVVAWVDDLTVGRAVERRGIARAAVIGHLIIFNLGAVVRVFGEDDADRCDHPVDRAGAVKHGVDNDVGVARLEARVIAHEVRGALVGELLAHPEGYRRADIGDLAALDSLLIAVGDVGGHVAQVGRTAREDVDLHNHVLAPAGAVVQVADFGEVHGVFIDRAVVLERLVELREVALAVILPDADTARGCARGINGVRAEPRPAAGADAPVQVEVRRLVEPEQHIPVHGVVHGRGRARGEREGDIGFQYALVGVIEAVDGGGVGRLEEDLR